MSKTGSELPSGIDALVSDYMRHVNAPGVAAGVTQSGNVLGTRGFGLADIQGTTVTADTVFEMASCTKTYTAWGVLWLQDQGQLAVTDPIGKYLSFSGSNASAFADVPIQNFLSMSGGLEDIGTGSMDWEQILSQALDAGTQYPPGTQNLYSNPSFMLMGELIWQVSGQTYADFMTDRMLGPDGLNLADTKVHDANNTPAAMATGYQWENDGWSPATLRPPSSSFSSGAMLSSASGLTQYMCALDDQKILTPAAYQALFTQVAFNDGTLGKWALGWEAIAVNDNTYWGKDGGLPGFSSFLLRDPNSGYSVVLAANISGASPEWLARQIMALLLAQ